MPNLNSLSLLGLIRNNPHGWGNFPAGPPEVATEDDAGNTYGFDNKLLKPWKPEPQQSWGEAALDVGTAPARLATGLASSLSPYGAEDGWQVPPVIAEPVRALNRLSEHGGFPNPSDPQNKQDMSALVMAMFGGNAFAPARAGEAVAARALSETSLADYGRAAYLSAKHYNEPSVVHTLPPGLEDYLHRANGSALPGAGVSKMYPQSAEYLADSVKGNVKGAEPGALDITGEVRPYPNDLGPVSDAERKYLNAQLATKKHDNFASIPGDLFSDTGKPSLIGSALAGAENHLPMDLESRMARAHEQGFSHAYHGTAQDFDTFRDGTNYVATDKAHASDYAGTSDGSRVMPLMVRGKMFDPMNPDHFASVKNGIGYTGTSDSLNMRLHGEDPATMSWLTDQGYDGFTGRENKYGPHYAVFDPSNIRSVNAAFDPQHAGKNGLLLSDTGKPSLMGSALAGAENHLPMDLESRMARAKEQGYNTDKTLYRGARYFDEMEGPTWIAESPDYAANFPLGSNGETAIAPLHTKGTFLDLTKYPADHGFDTDSFKKAVGIKHRGADDALNSLMGPNDPQFEAHAALDLPEIQDALNGYYSGVKINQYVSGRGSGVSHLVFDPSNIRSVNAAFDPQHAGKNGLLLSDTGKPSALGAAMAGAKNQNQEPTTADLLAILQKHGVKF